MQIIIPMSGVGKRFIDAGYKRPKPLIEVDGKPIIEHVVNLFSKDDEFIFICNSKHLKDTDMRDILTEIAPNGKIVEIKPHKKGPVYAVAQIFDLINDNEEVIVNYCDFGTYWDYKDFLKHTRDRDADGAVPSYKNFHPHMLGSTNYAFMRDDKQWMLEIKEKEPFTDNRMQEYASNGTYYFKKGSYIKKYFQDLMDKDINIKDEFYVSLIYNLLVKDGLKVSIYEIEHMLQWGTPQDVEEYNNWSNYFKHIINKEEKLVLEKDSITLIPLAGKGSRFANEGYNLPKPLLEISGKPMVIQAVNSLPKSNNHIFVCLNEHLNNFPLEKELLKFDNESKIIAIDKVTEGQAITCQIGLKDVDKNSSLLISASDNGITYNEQKYKKLIEDESIDAIVFGFKNHISSNNNPQMYGWIKVKEDNVIGVSVKKPISDTPKNDFAIVGTFYFRKVKYFNKALNSMLKKDIRVNGEFYVDSMVNELVEMGLKVKVFQVDDYICWGTPNDYKTYNYWQSFFHKCDWHPYSLKKDVMMNTNEIKEYDKKYRNFKQSFV